MGGLIFVFLIALLIVVLVTPAIRSRFQRKMPPQPPSGRDSPHEVVIRRLDDHRARRNPPRDDATDKRN
jgi:hypothetical protein